MKELIEKINGKIVLETFNDMDEKAECYLYGLSDALKIVEDYYQSLLKVGKKYYVISYINKEPKVEYMLLYRINISSRISFCFTRNFDKHSPDVVLYSSARLKMRVFEDIESAKNAVPTFIANVHRALY